MIIGITGFKRTGKSTVAKILEDDFGFQIVGLTDKLKAVLLGANPFVTHTKRLKEIIAEYGWELAKDTFPEVRRLMQDLATEGVRDNLGDDTWLDAWQKSLPRETITERAWDGAIVMETHIYGHAATPDVRFPNEVVRIRSIGGVVWKVTRPGYAVTSDKHRSETQTTAIEPDALIVNNGTVDDLYRTVHATMSRWDIFAV
jgi:dephospho-CoA kinase